jgi:hypothetical protein
MPWKTKFLNAAADNDYYLFQNTMRIMRLLPYNILKKERIEGSFKADEILTYVNRFIM